uniref:Uncharacterized protein n=1 Tax=Mola mola TaxID=94237 RepID=A0A3Q3WX26_MOLML
FPGHSLHLTTFCLQYSPPVVACVCIHLACKWSNWEIPVSTDGKHWWEYVDPTVTLELLDGTFENSQPSETDSQLEGADFCQLCFLTVAGLMSLSAPPSASSSSSMGDKDHAQVWSGKGPSVSEQQQPNSEVHTPAKVSLSEYRAKNADVLAAQKRKLENMEASVKRDYANAAQALIGQQQRKDNPSPIILKIPLEKERHDRSSLKMRFPVAGGSSGHGLSARAQDQDIKVRIRVPEKQRGGSGEEGKSRDKHRDASLSSSHKHSSGSGGGVTSSKKVPSDSSRTSSSSSSASRKRTHSQDPTAGSHPASKVSKSSRNPYQLPALPSSSGQTVGHSSDLLDKTDTNGHSAVAGAQSNEYQDTFEMLNSLLSAQGVQPAQPSMFDYRAQYGDYRYSGGSRGSNPRPPPLPSEPPPPLPPLPK